MVSLSSRSQRFIDSGPNSEARLVILVQTILASIIFYKIFLFQKKWESKLKLKVKVIMCDSLQKPHNLLAYQLLVWTKEYKTLTRSDQHSVQLSSLSSVLWWAFGLQDTVLHGWDSAGAGSTHSTPIWCGSTSQKTNSTTNSYPSQKKMQLLCSPECPVSSNVSLWNRADAPVFISTQQISLLLVAQKFRWRAPQLVKDSPHIALTLSLANLFLCFQQPSKAALLVSLVTTYSNPGFWSTA